MSARATRVIDRCSAFVGSNDRSGNASDSVTASGATPSAETSSRARAAVSTVAARPPVGRRAGAASLAAGALRT